jgi:hypothetical protein
MKTMPCPHQLDLAGYMLSCKRREHHAGPHRSSIPATAYGKAKPAPLFVETVWHFETARGGLGAAKRRGL